MLALMLRMHVPLTTLNLWGEHRWKTTATHDNGSMRELKAGNEIGDGGARGLGDALKTNTTLTMLGLQSEQQDHKETQ